MTYIGSILIICFKSNSVFSFGITIPIFLFLWPILLVALAKFFNDKWVVMELETKKHIETFFKEKKENVERRNNRTI